MDSVNAIVYRQNTNELNITVENEYEFSKTIRLLDKLGEKGYSVNFNWEGTTPRTVISMPKKYPTYVTVYQVEKDDTSVITVLFSLENFITPVFGAPYKPATHVAIVDAKYENRVNEALNDLFKGPVVFPSTSVAIRYLNGSDELYEAVSSIQDTADELVLKIVANQGQTIRILKHNVLSYKTITKGGQNNG